MFFSSSKSKLPTREEALPGRSEAMEVAERHVVLGTPLRPPFPPGTEQALFGMGCFWGAEKRFWDVPGVISTAVGYAGGLTPNPTYREVCSGKTGHAETVFVAFDPRRVTYDDLLKIFWESHDPTQGMRQGNDAGTQYRSALYVSGEAQRAAAERSKVAFQGQLDAAHLGAITTELAEVPAFFYAEDDHQQYLHKIPDGYCGLQGTGVSCPIGIARTK